MRDDPAGADSVLTVRHSYEATPTTIPRDKWQLTRESVTLTGGFTPGLVYELAYRTTNPRVGGVGLLALRDTASWFKNASEAPIRTSRVYAKWHLVNAASSEAAKPVPAAAR